MNVYSPIMINVNGEIGIGTAVLAWKIQGKIISLHGKDMSCDKFTIEIEQSHEGKTIFEIPLTAVDTYSAEKICKARMK